MVLNALLLFGAGLVAGTVNVIAGGGSLLTLPILIFLGLPASVANGTNRIAIVLQNVAAVWSFRRHDVMDWSWLRLAALPAVAGAAVGSLAALQIGDDSFRRILALLMVAIALWTLWNPLGDRPVGDTLEAAKTTKGRVALIAAFFFVGVYGGFVQAGVGFIILAVITLGGLNLVRGNALKALLVLSYMPLSLIIFAVSGNVDWALGLALAAGNLTGALIGVRLTVRKGHVWVRRAVTVMVFIFAARLLFWS